MKYTFCTLVMLLAMLFPMTQLSSSALAQQDDDVELLLEEVDELLDGDQEEEEEQEDEEHEEEDRDGGEPGIRIHINGEEIQLNEEQMEAFGERIEEFFEGNSEELEAWAERHADAWESWAEKFESKMERWAERTEEQWEGWAEEYSERWEDWGDQLEAGEIDREELAKLMENNLEMLSEMPLGDLIDGALKNSLGELKDAPLESLDELGDIVGGAIEQSLKALEDEFEGGIDINIEMGNKRRNNLKSALSKLQDSIERKRNQLERDSDKKLARMTELLKRKKDLDEEDVEKIVEKLKAEMAAANEKELQREKQKLAEKSRVLESEWALEKKGQAKAKWRRKKDMEKFGLNVELLPGNEKIDGLKERVKIVVDKESGQLSIIGAPEDVAIVRDQMGEILRQTADTNKALRAADRVTREKERARSIENEIRRKLEAEREMVRRGFRKATPKSTAQKSEMDSLEEIYQQLKEEKESLETKESKIEKMRREIRELREEIQQLKDRD